MFPQNSDPSNHRYSDGCEPWQNRGTSSTEAQEQPESQQRYYDDTAILNSDPLRKRVISASGYHRNQQQQQQQQKKKMKKGSEGQELAFTDFGTSSIITNTFQQQPPYAAASSASEVVLSGSTSSSCAAPRHQVLHQPSLPPTVPSSSSSALPPLTQPFLQMDPTFLALMMSNPAVAMAGLSAMAAAAPPASLATAAAAAAQHQQQQQQFIAAAAAAVAQIAAAAAASTSTTSASTAAPSSTFPTIMDAANHSVATTGSSPALMQECLSHTYRTASLGGPSPRNNEASSKGGIHLNSGNSGGTTTSNNTNANRVPLFHNPIVSDVSTTHTTSVSAAASSSSSSSTVMPGASASSTSLLNSSTKAVHHPMPSLSSNPSLPFTTNIQIGTTTTTTTTPNEASRNSTPIAKITSGKSLSSIPRWPKVTIPSHKSKTHPRILSSSSSSAAVVAAAVAPPLPPGRENSPTTTAESLNFATLLDLKKWKPAKLEKHVAMLQECNFEVPPPLVNLLTEVSKRKEDKRAAKRVANRKSASISRARKKAYLEEISKANERLKRQAMILNLLPDLVFAVDESGIITFCSSQVEKMLGHSCNDLVGESIDAILMPASRETIRRLIDNLRGLDPSEENGVQIQGSDALLKTTTNKNKKEGHRKESTANSNHNNGGENGSDSSREVEDLSSNAASNAAVISELSLSNNSKNGSEQPFPLSVVNVMSKRPFCEQAGALSSERVKPNAAPHGRHEQSASVTTSLTHSASSFESRNNSNNPSASSSDDCGANTSSRVAVDHHSLIKSNKQTSKKSNGVAGNNAEDRDPSDSKASSVDTSSGNAKPSTTTSDINSCDELTARQSQAKVDGDHSKDFEQSSSKLHSKPPLGNPSSLTYESLMKHSTLCNESNVGSFLANKGTYKQSPSLLGAGGRRHQPVERSFHYGGNSSGDSDYGEGSYSFPSSSTDNSCGDVRRQSPLAPACNIWLIRSDLTTVWCEVTSSVKRKHVNTVSCDECVEETAAAGDVGRSELSKRRSSVSSLANDTSVKVTEDAEPSQEKREFLMCLRPIRSNPERVEEALRFRPSTRTEIPETSGSDGPTIETSNADCSSGGEKTTETTADDSEISAVRSLILMSSKEAAGAKTKCPQTAVKAK